MFIMFTGCYKYNTTYYSTMDEAVNAFPDSNISKDRVEVGDNDYRHYPNMIRVKYPNGM
jgi:hypothetical protein